MNNKSTYTATCLFGLEKFLGEDIDMLGYQRIDTIDGRVTFTGDIDAIPRCNTWFRYAERLFVNIGNFTAVTFDELFNGVINLPLEQWIGRTDAFPVKGHSIKSKLYSIPDCQSIIKKAIVERLKKKYGISYFEETGTKYQIEFFILNDNVTIMIDTSGTALHKRGYRPQAGIAPLRETLAAALVKIARPRDDVLFWDPLCGSGTIPLEAALIITNTAPGLKRGFISETFPQIEKNIWTSTREEAHSLIKSDTAFESYASDIDDECVQLTKTNVKNAGMEKYVKVFKQDALTIKSDGRRGTIVCNPPYGERLFTMEQTEELYRKMGQHFKTLEPWQIYIISSHEEFERLYGRRADKVRKLYNGMIKCNYYQYFKKR